MQAPEFQGVIQASRQVLGLEHHLQLDALAAVEKDVSFDTPLFQGALDPSRGVRIGV
ncbi:MAG TPA: hypothetical protein VFA43_17850 [Gemmatimonadaceae bacterium]|nr:hypothetical protein [Gemmatimonadaceae bacterium]